MTRDEVLAALSRAEVDYVKVQVESKTVWEFGDAEWKAKAIRAAAEIIRESGWRPIAEAPSVIPPGRLGWWGTEKWYEVVTQYPIPKLNASTLGYTHYCPLDKPEPPAREDSKS